MLDVALALDMFHLYQEVVKQLQSRLLCANGLEGILSYHHRHHDGRFEIGRSQINQQYAHTLLSFQSHVMYLCTLTTQKFRTHFQNVTLQFYSSI